MDTSQPEGVAGILYRIGRAERRRWPWAARSSRSAAPTRLPRAEITWSCSEGTVWIATHSAEFLGMVEELDGSFVANDTARGTYNTYRTLREAKQAFEIPAGDLVA
jgi:hypothetical protein